MTADAVNESTTSIAAAVTAAACAALGQFYGPLEWWLLLAAALIVADLRFGVLAAKARGEKVRRSRMWRRTLNKAFDYFCWVTVAGLCSRSIGKVMGAPVVAVGILLVIYGIEINSCVNNYFEYKGIRKNFSVWKLFRSKTREMIEEKDPPAKGTAPDKEPAADKEPDKDKEE